MSQKIFFVLLVIVVVILIGSVAFTISTFYGANFKKALASENPSNKCATPAGYTDSEWREHMGHHPDLYKECLQ